MTLTFAFFFPIPAIAIAASGTTPVIAGQVVNAASYLGALAPGALATLYGSNLAGAEHLVTPTGSFPILRGRRFGISEQTPTPFSKCSILTIRLLHKCDKKVKDVSQVPTGEVGYGCGKVPFGALF